MEKWYELEIEAIEEYLVTNITTGLPQEQVDDRQQEYGKNVFETKKKTSLVRRILHQLRDVSTIVLLVAAALSFLLAFKEGSGFIEPIIILAIVILNVTLAITQEGKAEKALESLAEMNSPTCIVFRDDIRKTIDTSEVVIGDIIILETGSIVPADARLIESFGLSCDESFLTGESEPVEKDATISISGTASVGDQSNMVFSGCIVSTGHGQAIATATGMDTQMGQIASHLHNTETLKTPLQLRLDSLGRIISWIAIASALFLLAIGLRGGTDFGTMIMIAISMAVAAVPETLSLIVTLSLTNGVQKMVTKNALIRKLPTVETLGNTSVICSDKTGTLTQNRMTIKQLWRYGTPQISSDDNFGRKEEELLIMLALASNATIDKNEEGKTEYIGNATEVAIMQLLSKKGLEKSALEDRYPKVAEIPFSSERKRMSVVLKETNGYLIITKGALDRLPLEEMSNQKYQEIMAIHDSYAKKALRVIAVAIRYVKKLPDESELEKLEKNMSFVGLIGLIDPPRPQAAEAIEKAKKAGIQTVMITGDHATTASAIAEEIGILSEGKKVLTGSELSHMSEQELNDTVKNYAVYARVSPEDKIRIVKAWQENGDVVAMTGDGVNDAPALKVADVGISMGITGTEVAKNASDMVLTDDNFATIVEAVSVGRNVYENIKKTICFLLVCNLSEIVIMLFAQMAGWGIVLTPIMLLLINLLGDGIPGLQLAKEVSDEDIMAKKPVKRNQGLFTADMLRLILRQTVSCSVVSLLAFYIGSFINVSNIISASLDIGQTMAFLTIGWTSILHIFNVRSKKSVFETKLSNNKPLTMSAIAMVVVFGLLVATPIGNIFGLTHIGFVHWLIVIGLSVLPTLSHELGRVADNNPHSIRRRTYNYIKR